MMNKLNLRTKNWCRFALIVILPLFVKCGHLPYFLCLVKYYKLCFNFQYKIRCPTCKQVSSLNDICTFNEVKSNHPDCVLMRMFEKAFIICSHAICAQSSQLPKIHQHEINYCKLRRIHCPADRCLFATRV